MISFKKWGNTKCLIYRNLSQNYALRYIVRIFGSPLNIKHLLMVKERKKNNKKQLNSAAG